MRRKNVAGRCLLALVLCTTPVLAHASPRAVSEVELHFTAGVLANGTLVNVQPDTSLTPVMQDMVRKRVAGWRY